MDQDIKGGCACGSVRYRMTGEAKFSFLCQCRRCQHLTGSGHAPGMMVNRDQITLSGQLRHFEAVADSGSKVTHSFCPTCGSPIMSAPSRMPDICSIYAASLDDPSVFKPEKVIYREFGQPWDLQDPENPEN